MELELALFSAFHFHFRTGCAVTSGIFVCFRIHHNTTTTYQILIVLQNPKTPVSEPCFDGRRLALTNDGNEEFCLCNRGYTGDECEEKIVRPSASILDMPELEVWKKKLKVPGMFDLMDAIEKSAEVITNHVTEVLLYLIVTVMLSSFVFAK